MGFVVDEVCAGLRAKSSQVEHPPEVVTSLGSECIKGAWFEDRFLVLLGPNFE